MHQVVVIGAGFAGIGTAVALKRAGCDDFVVLERSGDIGGAWRDDARREVAEYLRNCADEYEVEPHIHFGAEVVAAVRDAPAAWTVTTADGASYRARSVVMAAGIEPRWVSTGGLRARLRRLVWSVGGCLGWYRDRPPPRSRVGPRD